MKLTKTEAEAARHRATQYEASMAIEGMEIHPDDRALVDYVDKEGIGYEEAIEMAKAHLVKRGVIAEDALEPKLAAE